jgi:hypothetical protein
MYTLVTFLQWEIGLLFGGLAFTIFCQILGGRINTRGLLQEKNGKGELSAGRLQLFLFTIIFALTYLFQVMEHPTQFPEIPRDWLLILGGSNVVYLGDKTYNLVFRSLRRL